MRVLFAYLSLGVAFLSLNACGDDPPSKNLPGQAGMTGTGGASGSMAGRGSGGTGGKAVTAGGTCEGFSSKLEACSLIDAPLDCSVVATGDAVLDCLFGCYETTDCEAATATYCFGAENSLASCMTVCRSFACNDGTLFPLEYRCDDLVDCAGGEDEQNCRTCDDGTELPSSFICDGYRDCAGNEDEQACLVGPTYQCENGETINGSWRCDGYYIDCADGSDEAGCAESTCPAPPRPVPGEACAKATETLSACGLLEGGVVTGCTDRTELLACAKNCIGGAACAELESYFCSSETAPPALATCFDGCAELTNIFPCEQGNGSVPASWICDGVPDCLDEGDEADCDFDCGDGELMPLYVTCDTYVDCKNGADERGCEATCPGAGGGGGGGASGD
jgi:hypothetical protein